MEVRLARPAEYGLIDGLMVRTYVDGGLVAPDSPYIEHLAAAAARATQAEVYAAVTADGVIGTVTFAAGGSEYAVDAKTPDVAAFRMLAVDEAVRGRGIGTALVELCVARARSIGARRLRLATFDTMTAAHQLYDRLGFRRTPDRDRLTAAGAHVITYDMPLA